jgi:hypothetical protein
MGIDPAMVRSMDVEFSAHGPSQATVTILLPESFPGGIGSLAHIGKRGWYVQDAGESVPVIVTGYSQDRNPIIQRTDNQPIRWRGCDRHVLDIPANNLLDKQPDPTPEQALRIIASAPWRIHENEVVVPLSHAQSEAIRRTISGLDKDMF